MRVTGRVESAPTSRLEGGCPATMSCAPSAATIAPLSVHRASGGIRSETPAAAARAVVTSRNPAFATTPPPNKNPSTTKTPHTPNDRLLKTRGHIGDRNSSSLCLTLLGPAGNRGFQSRKAEIVAMLRHVFGLRQATRKSDSSRVAINCGPIDLGTTGVRQAQ